MLQAQLLHGLCAALALLYVLIQHSPAFASAWMFHLAYARLSLPCSHDTISMSNIRPATPVCTLSTLPPCASADI